eukprot:c13898_g1_i4.p1 GENE.c13898_g1_i4~~c13898_g1_i4.p1  ORF type:complete len:181 (+),score=30.19 c13898_g1_i4:45-545(+)
MWDISLVLLVIAILWFFPSVRSKIGSFIENFGEARPARQGPAPERYKCLAELTDALQKVGMESSNLIIGIDFTKSNTWQGKKTFGNISLHALKSMLLPGQSFPPAYSDLNPYELAISVIGSTLSSYDADGVIDVYGFGDITTQDKHVFTLLHDCHGFQQVSTCQFW